MLFRSVSQSRYQREGLANATKESIGILAGSPGTGKTWTVASLVEAMSKTVGLKNICIGHAKAGKLFEVFGTEAIKICKEDPARVVETLKGVKIEQATSLAAALQEDEAIERIKLDLQTLLENRGFPKKTSKAAIEQWGRNRQQRWITSC